MSDNLRDRIEDTLRDSGGYSWRDKAQAVIDELGLTVEHQGGFDLVNFRNQIVRTEERSRYVTPWTVNADAVQVGERRHGKDTWFEGREMQ